MKCTDCSEPIRDREEILHCYDCGGWCHVECVMIDEDTADVRCEKCYWKHKRLLRKDAENPPILTVEAANALADAFEAMAAAEDEDEDT